MLQLYAPDRGEGNIRRWLSFFWLSGRKRGQNDFLLSELNVGGQNLNYTGVHKPAMLGPRCIAAFVPWQFVFSTREANAHRDVAR
jgi:hypothetical protein